MRYPRTKEQDMRAINREQHSFTGGMETDRIPNKVSEGSVHKLVNARAYGDSIRGREGTRLLSDLALPYDYMDVEASREGHLLAITSDHEFDDSFIGSKLSNSGESKVISTVI